jgi:transposase
MAPETKLTISKPKCSQKLEHRVIRSMVEREFGIKLSKSLVSRVFGHLGLSPQRPLYKSYKVVMCCMNRRIRSRTYVGVRGRRG